MNEQHVIDVLTKFYLEKGIDVPKTTTEYVKMYPKGYSNSVLSTNGIKLREVLDKIHNIDIVVVPKDIGTAVSICNDWIASGKSLPSTQREWNISSVRKGEIPFSAALATKYGFSILELLKTLNLSDRKVPENVDIYAEQDRLEVDILEYSYPKVKYVCRRCKEVDTSSKYTLFKREDIGCIYCAKIPGKIKPIEYYQKYLTEEYQITDRDQDAQVFKILHKKCMNTIERGMRYITRDSRDPLMCEYCSGAAIRSEGFTSQVEKLLVTYCLNTFPEAEFQREVNYSNIINTNRKFRADLFSKSLNLVLEITHADTGFESYLNNLAEKLELLRSNGIHAHKVTTIREVEDIVSSLLKDKE